MKWLILFPAWVFLVSYVIYRVKDANRLPDEEPASASSPGADVIAKNLRDDTEPEPAKRPQQLTEAEVASAGIEFRDRVQLIPTARGAHPTNVSPLYSAAALETTAVGLATFESGEKWNLFEDEDVSFMVPAGQGFRVERIGAGGELPMIAESYYSADRIPDFWLRVVGPGEVTWCAVAIDRADRFDLTDRYPEPEVFHKLMLAGGGAARISSCADGVVRRVQWLGNGVRVSLLDWQHCAAPARAYATVAATLRLRAVLPGGRAALGAMVGSAGLETRLGLLERGMGEAAVEALLGKPVGVADDTWVYHVPARGGDRYYRVPIVEGKFIGFRSDWRKTRRDPPVEGSLAWMREKTAFGEGPAGGRGYNLGVLTDEEVEQIFRAVRDDLPTADPDRWVEYCEVLSNMVEMGLRDDAALDILENRFAEEALAPCKSAVRVLRKWRPEKAQVLCAQKAHAIVNDPQRSGSAGQIAKLTEDLNLLLGSAGDGCQVASAAVACAAGHPEPAVRALGFGHWHLVDEAERRPLLRSGLDDEDAQVRRCCAEALAVGCAEAIDRPMLESILASETDAQTREHLSRAIEVLAEGRGKSESPTKL